MPMNEEQLLEKIRRLPPDKQQKLYDIVEDMDHEVSVKKPRHNPIGLCADLGVHISEEDIDEARREMWGDFPRDDI
jgi:hypothetical protein